MNPTEPQPPPTSPPFRSRSEFVTSIRSFGSAMRWPGYLFAGSMLVWGGFLLILFMPERNAPVPHWFSTYGIVAVFAFFVCCGVLVFGHIRAVRKHRLRCPSCQAELIHIAARLAICTGRCSSCGQRVFPKESSDSD